MTPEHNKTSNAPDPRLPLDGLPSNHPLLHEEIWTLAQAAHRIPSLRSGKSLSPSTIFRWGDKKGKGRKSRSGKRVYLEIWLLGGTNVTTRQAVARFFDRLNDDRDDDCGSDGTGIVNPCPTCPPGLPASNLATLHKQSREAQQILVQRGYLD
jgi:hypothetical protein